MGWVIFVAGAVLSWGAYGALLYLGQTQLGNPLKALLCVGVAYFLIGVLLPVGVLGSQGQLSGFGTAGLINATIAGALGAAGAACIIWAFKTGGLPIYVMPLVFGGAPVINTLVSISSTHQWGNVNPFFWAGLILVVVGAAMVLLMAPRGDAPVSATS